MLACEPKLLIISIIYRLVMLEMIHSLNSELGVSSYFLFVLLNILRIVITALPKYLQSSPPAVLRQVHSVWI